MKKTVLLLSLLVLVFALPLAAIDLAEIRTLSLSADTARYPDADTVLLYEKETSVYDEGALGTETDDSYEKILTEAGRKDRRTLRLSYNENYGTASVERIELIRSDGTVVPVDPAKNVQRTIDSSQMGMNIYDPAEKTLELSIPDLQIGDVLHVRTRRETTKARIPGIWCGIYLLQYTMPILRYEVEINAPALLPLRAQTVKNEVKKTLTAEPPRTEGSRIIYRWRAENVPQVIPEPGMPRLYSCVQRLLVSTASSWTNISRWYHNLCEPRIQAVSPEMRAMVQKLVAGKIDETEKIRAIFRFVSQEIRYMGNTLEKESPGYEPHDAKLTFERRYGVCRDKAALLCAMLREAKISARMVLFMAGVPKDAEVPNNYFNHAIVGVDAPDGKYLLMDPTNEATSELMPAYHANRSYLVAHPLGEVLRRTPVPRAEENMILIETGAELAPDGLLKGETLFRFSGFNDQLFRGAFAEWSAEERREFFAAVLKRRIPGAEILSLEFTPREIRDPAVQLSVKLKFSAPDQMIGSGGDALLRPPEFSVRFGAVGAMLRKLTLKQRKFNLELKSTCGTSEKFTLALPPQLDLKALPTSSEIQVENLLRFSRRITMQGHTLSGESSLYLDSVDWTPQDYSAAKNSLRRIEYEEQRLPVVRLDFSRLSTAELQRAFPAADSVVLADDTRITLENSRSGNITNTTRRLLLKYSAVKNCSEVSIAYNPVWESAGISGKVILPDGTERVLAPSEIHNMDAPWNSGAKRYPGGKILVANFPGVEPGCILETTTTLHFSGRNFYSDVFTFPEQDPVVSKTLTLRSPAREWIAISPAAESVTFSQHTDGPDTVRTWRAANLPPIPVELGQAPLWFFAPVVMISGGSYAPFAAALDSALRARAAVSGPLLEKWISDQRLRHTLMSRQLKIQRIRNLVAEKIRPAGPGFTQLPWSCFSTPDQIIADGYGNSADRAILTLALLRAAGINAEILAVSDLGYAPLPIRMLNRFPQNFFNRIELFIPGENAYLNGTTQYATNGCTPAENMIALNLQSGRLVNVQPVEKECSRSRIEWKIQLYPGGSADVRQIWYMTGTERENANRTFSEFTPELRQRYFERKAAEIAQSAELTGEPQTDFNGPVGRVAFTVRIPSLLRRTGQYCSFELPGYDSFASMLQLTGADRRTPFWRNAPESLTQEYEITVPKDMTPVLNRPLRQETGAHGSTFFSEQCRKNASTVTITSTLHLPAELVGIGDFGKLVQLQRQLGSTRSRSFLLKQDKIQE